MMCGGGSWQGYATEACMRPDCGNTTTGNLIVVIVVLIDCGNITTGSGFGNCGDN